MPKLNPDDNEELKVGDKITYEVAHNEDWRPRWDYEEDCGGSGIWKSSIVFSTQEREDTCILLIHRNGQQAKWRIPLVGHINYSPNRPGWFKRESGDIAIKAVKTPTHIWVEEIASHPVDIHTIPERILAQVIDRGERGVRRNLTSWPYGDKLVHKFDNPSRPQKIMWYWERS